MLISFNAVAGLVVIGSPSLADGLTASDAKKAYLGKDTGYNGGNLTVLELADSNAEKAEVHQAVTKKSLVQLKEKLPVAQMRSATLMRVR